jgi:chromosome segregation ATPase
MGARLWRKTGAYLLVALPVLGLAGIAVIAQQQQESSAPAAEDPVAAAARKAREQKKEAPKPKKVYTNEDVSSAPAAPAPTATESSAPAGETKENAEGEAKAETAPDAKAPAKNKNDEASWRARFKETREKLADAQKELEILQREAGKAQTQYYSDPQKALAEQYSRKDINDHDTKIVAKKQEIAQLQQHLEDMEDELRRSGGDLGWTR